MLIPLGIIGCIIACICAAMNEKKRQARIKEIQGRVKVLPTAPDGPMHENSGPIYFEGNL